MISQLVTRLMGYFLKTHHRCMMAKVVWQVAHHHHITVGNAILRIKAVLSGKRDMTHCPFLYKIIPISIPSRCLSADDRRHNSFKKCINLKRPYCFIRVHWNVKIL